MQWSDVVDLALGWPEVTESASYGEPSLRVRRRLLARLRVEDSSLVLLGVPDAERDHLIEMMPDAFFREPHYDGHDIVLAWLDRAPAETVQRVIERQWRALATKRAVAGYDARQP